MEFFISSIEKSLGGLREKVIIVMETKNSIELLAMGMVVIIKTNKEKTKGNLFLFGFFQVNFLLFF